MLATGLPLLGRGGGSMVCIDIGEQAARWCATDAVGEFSYFSLRRFLP